MKLSREWLNEFTEVKVSDKEFSDAMTMSGSMVEGVEITGEEISGVVVGKVLEMERHANSDHLWICKVDVGSEVLTIITGAQNVSVGDLCPTALDGASLAGGKKINNGEIRGVMSCGMLCSLDELGLDIHDFPYALEDGIFIMEEECEPGDDFKKVIGLGDSVVEFEITSNRSDCLSVRGLAREVAATFDTALRLSQPSVKETVGDISEYLQIEVADPELCPRYTARMVKNLKIGPSPLWMRRRLRASGVRPINNIVDITNYVMLEYGQPMHAFDYSYISGDKIIIRRAEDGEEITTLDGAERSLTKEMLLITDKDKPVAIAGVMGGENSEVTENTETVVFESATFNGTSVRKTSIALGLRTDASGRFEKGLDVENTIPAVHRACQLVEMLGAGEVVGGIADIAAPAGAVKRIKLEPQKINALLGTEIDREFMECTLKTLGFGVEGEEITVPSWRQDVEHYADLAEEVARFYGYDVIEATMFKGETAQGGYSETQQAEKEIGSLCRAMGYYEIMTYSFVSPSGWDKMRLPKDSPLRRAMTIQNPLGEDTSVMRTTGLLSILNVLGVNVNHRNTDVKLYEQCKIYLPKEDDKLSLPEEKIVLTLGASGEKSEFFANKGCIEEILDTMRVKEPSFEAVTDNPSYHPGRCARIFSGKTEIGIMGNIHPLVCRELGISGELFAAEIDFEALLACRMPEPLYVPLPRYPAVSRDISFVCDSGIPVAELKKAILKAGGANLRCCELFDVYTGTGIPEGKKSVAFSLQFRADDSTLTDEYVDVAIGGVMGRLLADYEAASR